MNTPITLTKGSHSVTTTSPIEAENLKGIGYRVDKPKPTPAPQPRPAASDDKK